MGRIRVLSDQIANKIAAGEVVERPASVVKELLENSLDAGATHFRIAIETGGRRLIRITDDGCGMIRDDAMLAFERHATSKLSEVKDLLSISTLGFRGEALPSIASVSRLLLETRSREETTGTRVEIAGGKMLRCDEAALAPGTTVTIQDLFYNVPARKKFLRSEQTETAHIASLVTHYSLAHIDKDFQLMNGNRELLQVTAVPTMRERVFQVFGTAVLDDLVDLGSCERTIQMAVSKPPPWVKPAEPGTGDEEPLEKVFRLRGFVSRPQLQKLNRNSIFLFVNGRLIRDRLLLHALSSAYAYLIPGSCYPFALLFLECDYDEVDVNVHPSKTEVRFRHQSVVHDFVRDAIRETLTKSRPISTFPVPAPRPASARPVQVPESGQPAAILEGEPARARTFSPPQPVAGMPFSDFTQRIENEAPPVDVSEFTRPLDETAAAELPQFTLKPTRGPAPRLDFGDISIPVGERKISVEPVIASLPVPESHGTFPAELVTEQLLSLEALSDLRPIGQLHDSFIVAAGRDGLWIIDQHVAHERILFEKVLRQRAAGRSEMQQLLVPVLIQVTPAQQLEYGGIAEELGKIGFETEPFGPRTIAVKAAPAGIGAADIERLLFEILEIAERELRNMSLDGLRGAIAASIACQAAIKINTKLDQNKMEWLLRELAATEYPMSCPHGRPIALRYSTRDILKGFHRV